MSHTITQFIFKLDTSYHAFIDNTRWTALQKPMLALTHLGDPISLLMISVAILLVLWLMKKPVQIIHFAFTMIFASGVVIVLKKIVGRERPLGIIYEDGYSFPSGHALISAVFFPLIIYTFKHYIKELWIRRLCILILLVTMLLIGWSRLYLGVHYLSDVIGGFIIGSIISSLSILIMEGYSNRQEEKAKAKLD